jgi:DNA-binding winged helix-turn-helix (wHTH) protein
MLLLLLAHPGDVVPRERFRDEIWSEGTFVDFERGLNAAMNKLRRALASISTQNKSVNTNGVFRG